MTIEKIRLKALFAEGLGRELEADLENIQVKVYKLQGAHDALLQSRDIISKMSGQVRDELYAGDIKLDPNDSLAMTKFIVARIQAVVAKLTEHADVAKVSAYKANGEREGIEFALNKVKKIFDGETSKLAGIMKAVEAEEMQIEPDGSLQHLGNGPRITGAHPGPSLRMQRQEEDATEEVSSVQVEQAQENALEEVSSVQVEQAQENALEEEPPVVVKVNNVDVREGVLEEKETSPDTPVEQGDLKYTKPSEEEEPVVKIKGRRRKIPPPPISRMSI